MGGEIDHKGFHGNTHAKVVQYAEDKESRVVEEDKLNSNYYSITPPTGFARTQSIIRSRFQHQAKDTKAQKFARMNREHPIHNVGLTEETFPIQDSPFETKIQ